MQHLDDALIAEWVDGAIAEDSPRYAAIEAHVDQCDECRLRVEEERALAGHVRQLLGVAAPPERVPDFQEVLHRAGTAPAAPRFGPGWRRLAWAATVVVAGGVGWYARGVLMAPAAPRTVVAARETAERPPAADAAVPPPPAPGEDAAAAAGATSPRAPAVDQSRGTGRGRGAGSPLAISDQGNAAGSGEDRQEALGVRTEATRERAEARRESDFAATPAAAEPRPAAQAAAPAEEEARVQKAGATVAWRPATLPEAERALGRRLVLVAGLAVAGVELNADGSAARVRQDLGDGLTLELVQSLDRPEGGGAARADDAWSPAAPEPTGGRSVASQSAVVDGLRVEARAPVSPDSLRNLMARLRAP